MKNRNDFDQKGLHEMLQNYSSDDILHYIHQREDVYNVDHINNTKLPMNLCHAFIKYANKNGIAKKLEEAVVQWIDIMKGELKEAIKDNFAPAGWGDIHYNIQFENLYTVEYVEYACGIGFCAELKDDFFNNDQSELRTDMLEYYMPHQGNLKTYLEDRMNEVINEYFSI